MGFDKDGFVWLFFHLAYVISVLEAEDVQYSYYVSMVSSCSSEIKYVSENTQASVSWNGEDPGEGGCKVTFAVKRKNEEDVRYQVCVKPEEFSVKNNGIYLRYYDGDNTVPSRVYTRGDNPVIFYGSPEKHIHLEVEVRRNSLFDLSRSYFNLEVSAVKFSSNSEATKFVLGVILGTMAVLGTIITVILVIAYKRLKKKHGPARLRWEAPSFLQPQDGSTVGAPNQVILSRPDTTSREGNPINELHSSDLTFRDEGPTSDLHNTYPISADRALSDSDIEEAEYTRRHTESPPSYDELPPSYNEVMRRESTL